MQESNSSRPSRARRFDNAPFQSQSVGWRNCCAAIFVQAKSRTLEKKSRDRKRGGGDRASNPTSAMN
jgi:hypothetical protein